MARALRPFLPAGFLAVSLFSCLYASGVRADAIQASRAEQLFESGKQRMAKGEYAQACALLAESFRIDPATGSLLALALCHEREGKLATSFREYSQVAERARAENRPDRERAARERATVLETKLSTLIVRTSDTPPPNGLVVRIAGTELQPSQLGQPFAVDGGTILVDASAPGKTPWRTQISVGSSNDTQIVAIPVLLDAASVIRAGADEALVCTPAPKPPEPKQAAPKPATPPARPVAPRRDEPAPGFTAAQWTGIGLLGGGVVGLGTGFVFTLRALEKNRESKAGCEGDRCTAQAREDRLAARTAGNVATITMVGGAALATAGLVSYLVGRRRPRAPSKHAFHATPWLTRDSAGAGVRGSF